MLHSLSHQGINRETYLRLSGKTEEETIEQAKPDAEQALRREAVLAAVAEAESLDPSEEEMLEAVREAAPGGEDQAGEAARAPARERPAGQPQGRSGATKGVGPGGGFRQAGARVRLTPGHPLPHRSAVPES